MRRLIGATVAAIVVSLAVGASAATAAPPTADPQAAADFGAGWLSRELTPQGFVASPTDDSKPDYVNTANAVVAFAAAGVARRQAEAALAYLEANVEQAIQSQGADAPGSIAAVILAADSLGSDVRDFGGVDLVARLLATQQTSGGDAGLFGSQDPTFDGAFRQGLSLLALDAAGEANAAGTEWLVDQQCSEGGWMAYRAETTTPCPPPSPETFTGPDSNSTAVALSALLAHDADPTADALGFLEETQGTDGGWAYIPASAQPSDPNSTALVIQALLAAGVDPAGDARFQQSGGDAFERLLSFQLGCEAGEDAGAFFFPAPGSEPAANVLATVQAVPAAAGETLPLGASQLSEEQPSVPCAAPGPRAEPRSPVPAAPSGSVAGSTSGADTARDTLPATGPSSAGDLGVAALVLLFAGVVVVWVTRQAQLR